MPHPKHTNAFILFAQSWQIMLISPNTKDHLTFKTSERGGLYTLMMILHHYNATELLYNIEKFCSIMMVQNHHQLDIPLSYASCKTSWNLVWTNCLLMKTVPLRTWTLIRSWVPQWTESGNRRRRIRKHRWGPRKKFPIITRWFFFCFWEIMQCWYTVANFLQNTHT